MTNLSEHTPDIKISVNQIFGIDTEMKVDAFSKKNEYVPEVDSDYKPKLFSLVYLQTLYYLRFYQGEIFLQEF